MWMKKIRRTSSSVNRSLPGQGASALNLRWKGAWYNELETSPLYCRTLHQTGLSIRELGSLLTHCLDHGVKIPSLSAVEVVNLRTRMTLISFPKPFQNFFLSESAGLAQQATKVAGV